MNHIREAFGDRPAESINKQRWAAWLDERAKTQDWKASTYNRWKTAVSLVYRLAIQNDKIESNPVSRMRRKQEANDLQPVGDGRRASSRRGQVRRSFDDIDDHAICSSCAECQYGLQQCRGRILRERSVGASSNWHRQLRTTNQ